MNDRPVAANLPTRPSACTQWVRWTLAAAVLASSQAFAGNLVTNGDFSAGNTGFSTDYTLTTSTPLFQGGAHGIYAIEPIGSVAGSSAYGDWTNVTTDPNGGNGNVFVADGATTANTRVWTETVTVTQNTQYNFSYYGAEISNPNATNATFLASINGTNGGALNATGSWQQSPTFSWNSGSSTLATLTLVDTNLSGPYNDFVLTDLAFTPTSPVPAPASGWLVLCGLGNLGLLTRHRKTQTSLRSGAEAS